MTIKELTERWRTPEGAALAQEALLALLGQQPMPAAVGHHEGRVDLRGFAIAAPSRSTTAIVNGGRVVSLDGVPEIRGGAWSGLDLSHAALPSLRFFGAEIRNCRFDKANCQDWRLWDSTVADSSFVGADLRHSALLTWWNNQGNAWRRVVFDRADLRDCALRGGVLDGCSFVDTKIGGNSFGQVAIRGCRFTGKMKDVTFDGRRVEDWPPPAPMVDVDFSEAQFLDVWFNGCHFQNVSLPDGNFVVPNFPEVAKRVAETLAASDRAEALVVRRVLQATLRSPGDPDSVGVINLHDYVRYGDEALAQFAESAYREAAEQVG